MITKKFTREDIGDWVVYEGYEKEEKGKLKSFDNDKRIAWVVYKCDGKWEDYQNYTGVATSYDDLKLK